MVQPNKSGYYFALDGSPDNPLVTAAGFEAIGSGSNSGFIVSSAASTNFVARVQDISGGTQDAITIKNNAGVTRWTVGVDGAEAGANAGSDLVIQSYNDAGVLIDTPMIIDRSSGITTFGQNVIAPNLQTVKTAFLYDSGAVTVTQPIPSGSTETDVGATITVPKTGLYILSGTVGVNVDATNGATFGLADDLGMVLQPTPPVVGVNPVALDFRPYSMPNTSSSGVDYGMQNSLVVRMTSNVPYQPKYFTDNVSTTMAAAGGVALQFTLTPLCT